MPRLKMYGCMPVETVGWGCRSDGLAFQLRMESAAACRYFTDRLIKACAGLSKLCQFFHIPFQSGDNDILRGMK